MKYQNNSSSIHFQDMIKCIGGFEVFIPHLEHLSKETPTNSQLFDSDAEFDANTRKLRLLNC